MDYRNAAVTETDLGGKIGKGRQGDKGHGEPRMAVDVDASGSVEFRVGISKSHPDLFGPPKQGVTWGHERRCPVVQLTNGME